MGAGSPRAPRTHGRARQRQREALWWAKVPRPLEKAGNPLFRHRKGTGGVPYRPAPTGAPFLGRLGAFRREGREPTREWDRSWARISSPHQRRCRRPNGRGLEHSGRSRPECYGGAVPCRAGEVSATWPRFTAAAPTVPCRHPRRRIGRRRRVMVARDRINLGASKALLHRLVQWGK